MDSDASFEPVVAPPLFSAPPSLRVYRAAAAGAASSPRALVRTLTRPDETLRAAVVAAAGAAGARAGLPLGAVIKTLATPAAAVDPWDIPWEPHKTAAEHAAALRRAAAALEVARATWEMAFASARALCARLEAAQDAAAARGVLGGQVVAAGGRWANASEHCERTLREYPALLRTARALCSATGEARRAAWSAGAQETARVLAERAAIVATREGALLREPAGPAIRGADARRARERARAARARQLGGVPGWRRLCGAREKDARRLRLPSWRAKAAGPAVTCSLGGFEMAAARTDRAGCALFASLLAGPDVAAVEAAARGWLSLGGGKPMQLLSPPEACGDDFVARFDGATAKLFVGPGRRARVHALGVLPWSSSKKP